jgi:transposase
MRTFVARIAEAFGAFDGVPQERLFDQMKAVITRQPTAAGLGART